MGPFSRDYGTWKRYQAPPNFSDGAWEGGYMTKLVMIYISLKWELQYIIALHHCSSTASTSHTSKQAKQARSHLPKIQLGCLGGCSWWDFDLASLIPRLRPTIDNRATNRDWKRQQLYGESSFQSRDLMHTALEVDNCARDVRFFFSWMSSGFWKTAIAM